MLSACAPSGMADVVRRIRALLRPGGQVLFRDYGVLDHAHIRFHKKGVQQVCGAECRVFPSECCLTTQRLLRGGWGWGSGGGGWGGLTLPPPRKCPADAHPSAHKSVLGSQTPAWTRIWMHLHNGTGNSPSPGQPTPGVVKQDKSSGGSADTTKHHGLVPNPPSDPDFIVGKNEVCKRTY